jgi:hypothetical protein
MIKMETTNKTFEYKRLKSTPGMWIIYFAFLGVLLAISIIGINTFIKQSSGDLLATKVYTIGEDVVSIKMPDNWTLSSSSDTDAITWTSDNGYESLSISAVDATSLSEASIVYMLELRNAFPDATSDFEYNEVTIGGKKMFAVQIMYESIYYLCGIKESGNTFIKFVYSASAMSGEISDIDTMIASINYRKKG